VEKIPYRLGIDLGSNSMGWAVLRLDANGQPDYLVRLGVRIFSNGRRPKDGASLAVDRRLARQQRRRRDRMLRRKRRLIQALRDGGLFPASQSESEKLKSLNPYELRYKGLSDPLRPYEFGRVILHLNQRRGFRSSRRTDRSADAEKEKGKIASAVSVLNSTLADSGLESLGSHLYSRLQAGAGTRARRTGDGANAKYEFYPDRKMLESEFDLLWQRQAAYAPRLLNDELRELVRSILLFQRPLRVVRPGRCSLNPAEDRAPLALPSVERFRIWQEINNIRWHRAGNPDEYPLTDDQRNSLFRALESSATKTFGSLKRLAGLPSDAKINLEGAKREKLVGNRPAHALSKDDHFGRAWNSFSAEEQDAIVAKLVDDTLHDHVLEEQLKSQYGLAPEAASHVLQASTVDGYSRLSLGTIQNLLPHLERGLTYDKAVVAAGYTTTNTDGDGSLVDLPYYGAVLQRHVAFGSGRNEDSDELRYGRIANPSVHIALNQLRQLVNALIARYGKPQEVVLELTRDIKLGWNKAREIEAEQKKRQDDNERLRAALGEQGVLVTAESMLRLRLYEEMLGADGLAAQCVYSGEQISRARLFGGDIEIDHILPYSRTLDDSIANKVLCVARANRLKGGQTPAEVFQTSPAGYSWDAILDRASRLRRNRLRRFSPDAMTRFDEGGGFLARQLNDTAYMSRVAREYVSHVCLPNRVWTTTGQLTGMLRAKWGLNKLLSHDFDSKNRRDHRHHAVDAVVIASIDRRLVSSVAASSARGRDTGRLLSELDYPWASFLPGLDNALKRVVISYRPDHGHAGALHNDTAYGLDCSDDAGEVTAGIAATRMVRRYVPLVSLIDKKPGEVRESICDSHLAENVATALELHKDDKALRRGAVEDIGKAMNCRKVRWRQRETVIPIAGRQSNEPYKFVKGDGNYCYEIWADASGKWTGEVLSMFVANGPEFRAFASSPTYRSRAFSGHQLQMRLVVGDTVRMALDGIEPIWRVQQITKGTITLSHHLASGDATRKPLHIPGLDVVKRVSPSTLRTLQGRRVFVDILGRVKDPGFKDVAPDSRDSRKRPIPVG
jgi:CRISPR-associated endonuclease Csn1